MSQAQTSTALTPERRRFFEDEGYLVLQGLFEPALVSKLRDRVNAIAAGAAPLPPGVQRMVEPAVERGDVEVKDAAMKVRKLEGVPLAQDPSVARAAHHPVLVSMMQELLGEDLKLLRAAAMMKPPRHGSAKGLHQDAAYYPIEPREHIAAWLALDPATVQNGCMRVVPKAHKAGYREHETREYETDLVIEGSTGQEEGLIDLPMAPGDVLLTHCLTPHCSAPNRSEDWRRALILGYMSAKSRYTVPEQERPSWVRSILIAGGEHPGCV